MKSTWPLNKSFDNEVLLKAYLAEVYLAEQQQMWS